MGLRAHFTVTELGFPEATPELGIPIDYSEGCEIFAEIWEEVATDLVPVDTGYLQSTLEAFPEEDGCTCETLCDYAEYVEYGTIKMEAQPYFEPAIIAALEEAEPAWMEAYEEALEEEQAELEKMEEELGEGGNRWAENNAIQMSLGGSLLGMIAAAFFVGIFNVVMNIAFGNDRSSSVGFHGGGGSLGGGSIEIEII